MAYAELAARSNFTFLDGASHPGELVRQAAALGQAGIGLCDANGLAGVVRGHVAAKEAGLPYAVGCRLILAEGGEWLVWPTCRASYGRLTALLSEGRMTAPKGECHLTRAQIFAAAEGWAMAAVAPRDPDATFAATWKRDAAELRRPLALPLLLAVSHTHRGDDRQRLAHWAALEGENLLATGDVRYHHPGRRPLADLLSAIRLGTTVAALGHAAEPNAERHLKAPAEMARLFAGYPQALANTLRVLEVTRGFSLDQLRYEYPEEVMEPGRTAQETLESRVTAASAKRWPGGVPPRIQASIVNEMQLIAQLGYAPYFLTVHEIVRFARERGILCQGRGSAANSVVCYALGITSVDPEKHDLLFARFLSASRGEPPDIDIDFEHERREEVIQHLYERYGRDRAAICATVIRYRTRSAIREAGKAMGLSEDVTARLAKASWGPGGEMPLEQLAAEEGLDATDPLLRMTLELSQELQDFPRHTATHVGGFVITRGRLTELAVVTNAAMADRTVLEWDKDDIEALGILKVDVLGLGMLTCLKRAFDLMRQHELGDHDLASLPKDCPETFAMLRRADSLGVFQVESRAQMNMLPRLRPARFYDLVIQVAIVRPGPIQGDMVHPYLRRRQGLEVPEYPAPAPEHGPADELKRVLEKTLGVPLFQEQAMQLAITAAGFSPDEADELRRAMATFKLTGGVAQYRDKLVQGMVRRGYEAGFAERVFAQIEGFGSYGFPESHAASFAHLVYSSSWVKRWQPAVFAAALLNSQPMGFYAPAQIVRDAREHGVEVRPVDVNASDWDCTLEGEQALRLGLRLVAGLQEETAKRITKGRLRRNGTPYASPEDLRWRVTINVKELEALAAANAFGGLGLGRRRAAWMVHGVRSTPDHLPLFALPPDSPAAAMAAVDDLMREASPRLSNMSEAESVVQDYQTLGLTLGSHPLALLRPRLQQMGLGDTRNLNDFRRGKLARLPGLVLMRQRPGSAKGVVFLTVEDEFGVANLVVYPAIAAKNRAALICGRLLIAEGRLEQERDATEVPVIHLIISSLEDVSGFLDELCGGRSNHWANHPLGRGDEVGQTGRVDGLMQLRKMTTSRDFH